MTIEIRTTTVSGAPHANASAFGASEGPVVRVVSGALSLALLLAVGMVLLPLVLLAVVLSAGYALLLFATWLVRERLASWGWITGRMAEDARRGVKVIGRAEGE